MGYDNYFENENVDEWINFINNGGDLKDVPKDLITKEMCELAVNKNGNALYFVPKNLRTKELCKIAVKKDWNALYCSR